MNGNRQDLLDTWVDQDDAPELDGDFFERADLRKGDVLVRPGRGRPPAEQTKQRISIRLSPEVLREFRATGPGWQGRIDNALKDWLKSRPQFD
jgi:uncharacterized protein (DUF4415 family)